MRGEVKGVEIAACDAPSPKLLVRLELRLGRGAQHVAVTVAAEIYVHT